jgi:hypothetical protein
MQLLRNCRPVSACLSLCTCLAAWGAVQALNPQDGAGAKSEPLPKGALVRIRTARPGHEAAITSIAFSPDGATLASSSFDEALCLWDPVTGKELRRITGHPKLCSAVFSPDGLTLVSAGWDGTVRFWQAASGRPGRVLHANPDRILSIAFCPDGKTVAAAGPDGTLSLWYVATGERMRVLHGRMNTNYALGFSPDGKWLASSSFHDHAVQLCAVEDARTLRRVGGTDTTVNCFAFSPDGKSLVTGGTEGQLLLWEVATAGVRLHFKTHASTVQCVAFAPDGQTLASGHDDGLIGIWDTASGKQRYRLAGHRERVRAVAFAPTGKLLASGSEDMNLVVWDAGQWHVEKPAAPGPLSGKNMDALWDDLASDNASRAYQAVLSLAAAPRQSVPLFAEKMRHAGDLQARIARLVSDLDSDRFPVRQKASSDLEVLGRRTEAALRGELSGHPSPEVRRRIERLLNNLPPVDQFVLTPEQARLVRVVEVLERAGTSAAREMLVSLAKASPQKSLRQEAQASLERLAKRTGMKQ